jgi:prepilin-type processing-associated H-X9-DG protein
MTFIELIVLIFVLALFGLMVPASLHHAREKARRASCLGNHKQIGLAMRLYSGDFQERFPTDKDWTTLGSFALLTNKYQTAPAAWTCPSERGLVVPSRENAWTSKNVSFAYGGFGLTESVQPDTPVMCDRSSQGHPVGTNPWSQNKWTHKSAGGNVLYADGHAAFVQTLNPPMYHGKNP